MFDGYFVKYFASVVALLVYAAPIYFKDPSARGNQDDITQDYIRSMRLLQNTSKGVGDLVLVYKRITNLAGHTSRVAELLEQVTSHQFYLAGISNPSSDQPAWSGTLLPLLLAFCAKRTVCSCSLCVLHAELTLQSISSHCSGVMGSFPKGSAVCCCEPAPSYPDRNAITRWFSHFNHHITGVPLSPRGQVCKGLPLQVGLLSIGDHLSIQQRATYAVPTDKTHSSFHNTLDIVHPVN